jgi:hypothetical protein
MITGKEVAHPMAMSQSSSGRSKGGVRLLTASASVLCPSLALFALPLFSNVARAQELMPPSLPGGEVRLFTSDAAILESTDNRKDLPCTVTAVKPFLGFDMKFHGGYDVQTPLKELSGAENQLTMVFRVVPEGHADSPVYFKQHYSVPAIDENAGGSAYLQGAFELGEGKYHVDWLMRDRTERICSFHWDSEASIPQKDRPMTVDISPGAIQPADAELFREETPVQREKAATPLNVKVMVNFAPQDSSSSTMQPFDTIALVSILRSIARDPRVGCFSVVAYNMQEQRVIYRQQDAAQIDFPALGQALTSLNLGTIDLKRLSQKHGDSEFLSKLITSEMKEDKQAPDAVIFAGPKIMLDDGIPGETLKQLADVKFPVFYMNYNLNPQANPWRDAIGSTVKALKGAEFTIARPRDLFFSWTDIVGRIVKSKFGRTGISTSSQ